MTTLQSGATARPVRPIGHSPRPREGTNLGAGAIATGAAVVVYFVAAGIELLLIRTLRLTEVELAWISDTILAFAFGSAVFLWLHLKWTRMTLESSGPPAGLLPNQVYQTLSSEAPPGAVSILVRDGITEALDVLGLADRDPVAALLAQASRPLTPHRLCDALIERTAPALAKGEWQDDRTVVAFSFDSRQARPPGES